MFAPALRRSALGEVRQSPRFLALMLVMLVAAIGYGGRDVSRLRYTTELTGDALGIGVAAAVFAVGLALGGLASGPITDRTVTPSTTNSLGTKGVGEAGAIASPPAIINAIVDALRPMGVTDVKMPATPENVWRAIQAGQGGAQ